jgi:hypothetical protein
MSRGIVERFLPSILMLALASMELTCNGMPTELPAVKTSLATDLGCPATLHGHASRPVRVELSDGTHLSECAMTEFGACRPGHVRYRARVSERGELFALAVSGSAPSEVLACVDTQLRDAVVMPAADCRNQPVAAELRGNVEWGPTLGLQGSDGSILGAVWPCSAAPVPRRTKTR